MSFFTIIDTFPQFQTLWKDNTVRPVPIDRLELWEKHYMSHWPELLHKQQQCYADDQESWMAVARERIMPYLAERFPSMTIAHGHLLQFCEPIYARAVQELEQDLDVLFFIYVGIGCGAGWVNTYQGRQAIFLGLEMIAECNWSDATEIQGLLAHELGHVFQYQLLTTEGMAIPSGGWWQLFSEGFAQRCEHLILGYDSWHQSQGVNESNWLAWCMVNRGRLAAMFLDCMRTKGDLRPFFGSWFDIEGHKQCGYYLGHEVVRELQRKNSLAEIALMPDYEAAIRSILIQYTHENE